jgi:hypothetical protein
LGGVFAKLRAAEQGVERDDRPRTALAEHRQEI